ncbi:probable disease resistance protein At4g27220 isoform X2 [Mangifera indica]|uniref:probable disease resistance protein At4g27220 isoform X2 n=1 Tax=Mangifera indica TaxID=29780 RepID=UPI001CFA9C09|nr:probable disease resistance protein At4g27220 isoform X2 [Mangifera indica]
MADRVALVFETVCNRLDSHAKAFWNTKQRKLLRLKLEEVQDLLNQDRNPFEFDEKIPSVASRFAELEEIAYGVDELIDDWEQSEKSKVKIEQQVRRILVRLVRVLESFHKLIAGEDEEISAIPDVSFPGLGDFVDLELLHFNTIISLLLRNDEQILRFIPFVGIHGAEKSTLLAQRIYNDEMVKSYFQSRAWVSVGENLEIDKIVEAIVNARSGENVLPHNRFLLVLNDVSEADDTRLEKLKSWLKKWLEVEGSCVLMTTRFRRVADVMGTVPEQHLSYSSIEVPLLRPAPGLEHEQGLEPVVLDSVGMTSTSRGKDESTSAVSGHFEVKSERLLSADTASLAPEPVVMASTSESKDPWSSAILDFEAESERVQAAGTSLTQEAVAWASFCGSKYEPTSAVSGHFEVRDEKIKASDTTSLTFGYQAPTSSLEIVEEDVVPFPPQIGTPLQREPTASPSLSHSSTTAPALVLSKSGKNIDQAGKKKYVKQVTGHHSDTELHLAAQRGDLGAVKQILADIDSQMVDTLSGADFDAEVAEIRASVVNEVNEFGETALFTAADKGHIEVVKELLKYSTKEGLTRKNKSMLDPLHIAAIRGHHDHDPSSEIVEEDVVPFPPQMGTPPARKSEIQIVSLEAREKMPSIYNMESEIIPSQTEGEHKMKCRLKASAQQSVTVATKEAIEVAVEHLTVENEISVEDQLLQESVLFAKKSIKTTVQKIFSHINNVRTTKIAVIGTGGIGKTTVLKALINFPGTKGMFDVVISVTVSRYWNTRKVQNEVLRQLSLGCEYSETDAEVAERLYKVLKGKKFLLILDDVWEQINLEAVGIPSPSSENGCKIVIASRKFDVCHDMNLFKVVEVKSISWKEARELFYEQVSRDIPLSDIKTIAETIVKGCGGLPLLIIVTGRALGEKNDVSIWKDASKKFSLHKTSRKCQIEDVLQLLKFSFDQLSDNDVKSCFLHCALFSEAQEVSINKFIEYCIQERLITGAQADAHRRGRYIVDILIHASFLQATEGGNSIKMHDLIRDLALRIISSMPKDIQFPLGAEGIQFLLSAYARSIELPNAGSSSSSRSLNILESSRLCIPEGNQFLLRVGAGLTEPPLMEEWKQAKMMFLSDNELCTLPEKPNCPELLALFLQRNRLLRVIPPSFFDCMTSLKVLNLSETRIRSLPERLFKLKNLLILIVCDCKRLFMLPSDVGSLLCLEVLNLRGTKIKVLPDKIGELTSLKRLEVSFYGSIDDSEYVKLPRNLILSGIISKLCNLDTLSIVLYPGDERWHEDVKYVKTEVSKLKNLKFLCFHFPEVEHVQEFLTESEPWKKRLLTEFKFVVGRNVKSISSQVPEYLEYDYNQQGQCLRFVNGEKKPDEVLQILARSTAFYLDNHLDIESLSNFGVRNINGLKFCIISGCPKVKMVVHVDEVKKDTNTVFPFLETLSIHHLWNLTAIWEGILPERSFAQLRILSLHGCPKMEYVFRSSMIQYLCKLEELIIEDCQAIEQIIFDDGVADSCSVSLPSLKKLTLHYLPGLITISSSPWPQLEYVSFYCCPNLKKIDADSRFKDVIIKAEKSWWDALEWEDDELRLHIEKYATIIFQDHL